MTLDDTPSLDFRKKYWSKEIQRLLEKSEGALEDLGKKHIKTNKNIEYSLRS
jgi:hypothetical protein